MDNIEKSPAHDAREPSEPEVFTKDVKQVDRAALFLAEADVENASFSAAQEKKLLRKIDWILLPMVMRTTHQPLAFTDCFSSFSSLLHLVQSTKLHSQPLPFMGYVMIFISTGSNIPGWDPSCLWVLWSACSLPLHSCTNSRRPNTSVSAPAAGVPWHFASRHAPAGQV